MCDSGLARRISATGKNAALASAVAIVAALWMFPAPAHACSCDFPADWGFIGPESGRLPANAAGVARHAPERYGRSEPRAYEDLAARFAVEVREDGEFRPLAARVRAVEGLSDILRLRSGGRSAETRRNLSVPRETHATLRLTHQGEGAVGGDQTAVEGGPRLLALDGWQIEGEQGVVGLGGRGTFVAWEERRPDNEFPPHR